MNRYITVVIAAVTMVVGPNVLAQEQKQIPPDFYDKLAQDLAKLQAEPSPWDLGTGYKVPFKQVVVSAPNAQLYAGADPKAVVVKAASEGSSLTVLDKVDKWYAVTDGKTTGWIVAADVRPVAGAVPATPGTDEATLVAGLLRKFEAFQQQYKDNPYVRVAGFSITVSFPPALTVDFEVK